MIGDTMEAIRLIDTNFKGLPMEEKRAVIALLDVMMKRLHKKNLMVNDFNPANIYYQDGIYFFDKVVSISSFSANNKEEAVFMNILGLADLAFCSYLPDYHLEEGLLSYGVISENFNSFASYLPEEDRSYYKAVLVEGYQNGKASSNISYYSDYLIKDHNVNSSKGNKSSLAYVKATEAGRVFASQDEAAFGHNFFILTVVGSLVVILTGLIFYFINYLF